MKGAFEQFLKENNAYFKFKAYSQVASEDEKTCLAMCFHNSPENWINLAFRWNNTDEGFEFWNALSNKWKKAVSSKTVTIQLKSCNKGNTEISLDIVTALERMGYVAEHVKVE